MPANSAIHFLPEAVQSRDARVFGREAANRGFLSAFVRHSGVDTLYCCTPAREQFAAFHNFAAQCGSTTPAEWVSYANLSRLAQPGCL